MREILKAREGFILTDGCVYGTTIILANSADKDKFYEIPLEEYAEMLKKEIEERNG
jgi:hypothetical protein